MPPPGIKARIERFWRAVRRLESLGELPPEKFMWDENAVDAAERNFQVAAEALTDVGEFIISESRWRSPKSYREVGRILAERGLLGEKQAKAFEEMIGLKHVLVHNYVYLEPKQLHETIRGSKGKFTELLQVLLSYIDESGIDP